MGCPWTSKKRNETLITLTHSISTLALPALIEEFSLAHPHFQYATSFPLTIPPPPHASKHFLSETPPPHSPGHRSPCARRARRSGGTPGILGRTEGAERGRTDGPVVRPESFKACQGYPRKIAGIPPKRSVNGWIHQREDP